MPVAAPSRAELRGERFAGRMAWVVRRLPFGLARVVPVDLLGFATVNAFCFAVDILLLSVLRSGLSLPLWISVSVAYACAFAVSFLLNRTLNFRSHAAVGPQAGLFAVVVVVDYLALILGVGTGLAALGVDYRLARVAAGACEAGYMYCAMRFLVFRPRRVPDLATD